MPILQNFSLDQKQVNINKIFDLEQFRYKHSITLPLSSEQFEDIKKNGWYIKLQMSHWVNRASWLDHYRRGRNKRVELDGYYTGISETWK
jgi:hypothetical protein